MSIRSPRGARRSAAVLLVLAAAACTDQDASPPTAALTAPPEGLMGTLQCEVTVATGQMTCVDASAGGASASLAPREGPALDQRTFGQQGTLVRLTNSGNTLAAGVFSMNVTVQNLANLAMATDDGATRHATGVQVFFASGPVATGGAGEVEVSNATGTAMFTAADQPYFQYGGSIGGTDQTELGADGILASAEASTSKQWQFTLEPGVTTFGFTVMIRTHTPSGTLATVAPQVSGFSVATLVPGQAATITGSNFNPTPASNTVTIGGVAATVTGGSTTSLDVVVPCTNSGNVAVQVSQGGMSGVAVRRALLAPQRTLGVGESVIVTNTAQVGCNEIMPSGGASRYVVAVYNAGTSPTTSTGIQISGDLVPDSEPVLGDGPAAARLSLPSAPSAAMLQGATSDERHMRLLETNRREFEQLRTRFAGDPRMRASRDVVSRDPVPPPATRTFHVSNINSSSICSNYYVAAGTRVYYNGKIAIYEDDATPAGLKAAANPTMQDYYNRIGDQFNTDMEPVIRNNFGDVLRRDAETDNNGVLIAFFTPLINNNFANVAGFVVSCDLFPDADAAQPAVGGPYTGTAGQNGASNFGEVFYAYQPTNLNTGFTAGTADQWYRTIRSTFIHETKHVASNVARVSNGSSFLEAAWLEEGTARHSEELWMRNAVDNVGWKANTGYGTTADPINVYCDVRPTFNECLANTRRPASIMQRHFTSLYTHLFGTNARLLSPFGLTPSDNASYYYAVSWSLARYAIDRYGASDAAFLTALTQSTTTGVTNLTDRAGVPIDQLLGGWALALAVDDYPGLATPGVDVQMPTWNFRNIYAGLNADFPSTYTLAYPNQPTSLTFGNFAAVNTATMYGGGVLWYQISGTHTQPQLVRLRGNNGAALSSNVRVAIVRVQ